MARDFSSVLRKLEEDEAVISVDLIDQLQADWAAEMPDLDTSAMAIAGRITVIAQKMQQSLALALKPFDLRYSDFDVLATLRRSGAPYSLTPTQLMQSVLLTSGAITALLGRLEARGLISRTDDESDGRVKKATLTPAGRELIEQAAAVRFAEARKVIACLSEDQAEALSQQLRNLNQRLDAES